MRRALVNHFTLALLIFLTSFTFHAAQESTLAQRVINEDIIADTNDLRINLKGVNTIEGSVCVHAQNGNITFVLLAGFKPVVIQGGTTGPAHLQLLADADRKITFIVQQNDLIFKGSPEGGPDLLLTIKGPGTIEFVLGPGRSVTFTADEDSGGVQAYLDMRAVGGTNLVFKRFGPEDEEAPPEGHLGCPGSNRINPQAQAEAKKHVEIVVGLRSVLSFIASEGVETEQEGVITFNGTNSGKGRMVLRIKDEGAFVIDGLHVDNIDKPFLALENIDPLILVPSQPRVEIVNTDQKHDGKSSLLVINENKILPALLVNPWGEDILFGSRFGFILGATGLLAIGDSTYLDYVGLSLNECANPAIAPELLKGRPVESVIKPRNPSAFIVDGSLDPTLGNAQITMGKLSGLFFRSGVDNNGVVHEKNSNDMFSFVINPIDPTQDIAVTPGPGSYVFVIEGLLDIIGSNTGQQLFSKIELLSLNASAWGSLFPNGVGTFFPIRNFARDAADRLLQYNKGAFLINNRMNLFNVALAHTDENHRVCEKDDKHSEPTYVGGESAALKEDFCLRPIIAFYNAALLVQTSVAFTGLDLLVPNLDTGNLSRFIFFQNGRVIDDGSGRNMILGTKVGSFACDETTVISSETNLLIMQDSPQEPLLPPVIHQLELQTAPNDSTVVQGITGNIADQFSIQTIFIGRMNKIQIGTNADLGLSCDFTTTFSLTTFPHLFINGNYFSFEGNKGQALEVSNVTGKDGIFVDTNGKISIESTRRANMAVMVTKSHNGIIDLPKNRVFFDLRVGIADRVVDLTIPDKRVLIQPSECLSEYTLNWPAVIKDFSTFVPYEIGSFNPFFCPPVTRANVSSLPVVEGIVDQFQVKGSRLGDAVNFAIDGGHVKELVFLSGNRSAEAPVGVVTLQNDGRVGLGSANRNVDSLEASVVLGVNGVTIIANGDGVVALNSDLIINNVCHILAGPDFGVVGEDRLSLHADSPRSIYVRSSGVLDLSSFTKATQVCELTGCARLILEPGARVVLGGGILRVTDQSEIHAVPLASDMILSGSSVTSSDDIRVRHIGTGAIQLVSKSRYVIYDGAVVGVETFPAYTNTTNLTFNLLDSAQLLLGETFGGVLQIGNTQDFTGSSVSASFVINGQSPRMVLSKQSMLGLGVGIVDKQNTIPNQWLVGVLNNVSSIGFNIISGTLSHNQIFSGDSPEAALLTMGGGGVFSFVFNLSDATILGGGNMFNVLTAGAVNPIVTTVNSATAGMLSSKPLLADQFVPGGPYDKPRLTPTNATGLFNYLKTIDTTALPGPNPDDTAVNFSTDYIKVNAGPGGKNRVILGFVDQGFFARFSTDVVLGFEVQALSISIDEIRKTHLGPTRDMGAASAILTAGTPPRNVNVAIELP